MRTSTNMLYFVCLFVCVFGVKGTDVLSGLLHRDRRQLLFPNSTLLQFNAGVGTPTPAMGINVNWAFQANFQLPWNRTQIPVDILNVYPGYDGDTRKRRSQGVYQNDAKLLHFYKYVEEILNGYGYDGKSCVQKTLCQVGAEPLHSGDDEDLLHELAAFVLDPTNDADENLTEKDETYPYIEAYTNGVNSNNCGKIYKSCEISLIDMFTQLVH